MSKDIIYREDAIKAINLRERIPHDVASAQYASMAINAIYSVPSADRPQGEWIPATWQDENCPERLKRHKCSECGQRAEQILVRMELVDNYYCNKAEPITEYTHKEQLSKYCPNCGAKMKGADDDSI